MTPASTRKAKKEHRYYRCVTRDKKGGKACTSRPLSADAIEAFVLTRIREVAADGTLAADVERRLGARIESRRDALVTERRDLPPKIAKLAAEGRRLVEKIGEANGAAASLLDQRIAEVGDQLGRAEQRLAQVERAAAALDHAEIETKWIARALADFDAIWDVLTTDNRARLVRALVRSVAVDEPTGNVTALLTDLELDDLCPESVAGDHTDFDQAGDRRAAPSVEAPA